MASWIWGAGTVTVGDYHQLGGSVVNGTLVVTLFAVESGEALAALSGGGALEKSGPGNFVLQGSDDYSGGTLVAAGTLAGNAASLQGDFVVYGGLQFAQPAAGVFSGDVSGDVSGTGWISKTGPGTLLMTRTNTHTGGTLVSNGILRGDTGSLQGNIANNAELVFEQTSPGNHSGQRFGPAAQGRCFLAALVWELDRLPGDERSRGGHADRRRRPGRRFASTGCIQWGSSGRYRLGGRHGRDAGCPAGPRQRCWCTHHRWRPDAGRDVDTRLRAGSARRHQ